MTGIKNKKWISILLAAAMTLGMTGCSGSAEKEPAVEKVGKAPRPRRLRRRKRRPPGKRNRRMRRRHSIR